jgi:hypothetical protein
MGCAVMTVLTKSELLPMGDRLLLECIFGMPLSRLSTAGTEELIPIMLNGIKIWLTHCG